MWTGTELTRRIGIACPVIQGPLGGGLSSVPLVATVSNAGGLGSYGANALTPPQIREVAAEIRSRPAKPFALNLWVTQEPEPALDRDAAERAFRCLARYHRELGFEPPAAPQRFGPDFEAQCEAVLAAEPAVFSFVFGIPPQAVLRECRRRGIVTIGTATTVEEALALQDAGVDAVAATGMEAGGMRPYFLPSAADSLMATFALMPAVVDAVSVPVAAAGGIADSRGVAAALALGAQAVQIGTAFLACDESNAPALHREALLRGDAKDTVLSPAFNGRPARVIRNRFTHEMAAHEAELPPFPIRTWFTGTLRKAAIEQGRADLIALQASQAAALLRHRSAAALMADLTQDLPNAAGSLSHRSGA